MSDTRTLKIAVLVVMGALCALTIFAGRHYFMSWGYPCPEPETLLAGDVIASAPVVSKAWKRAFDDVGGKGDLCEAMQGVKVELRLHRDSPLMCTPGRTGGSPWGSCVHLRDDVYPVEVNVARAPGAMSTDDVLAHEFTHVVMDRVGWASEDHHMRMWGQEGLNHIVIRNEGAR